MITLLLPRINFELLLWATTHELRVNEFDLKKYIVESW